MKRLKINSLLPVMAFLTLIVSGTFAGDGWAAVTITATDPATPTPTVPKVTDVVINKLVTATFSGDMDESTIDEKTFYIEVDPDANPFTPQERLIPTQVSYDAATRTASWTGTLRENLEHFVTIVGGSSGIKDSVGGQLDTGFGDTYKWSFITGAGSPLMVVSTGPNDDDTNVAVTTAITAIFSKSMNALTLTTAGTFTVTDGSTDVSGTVTYDEAAKTARFTLTPSGTVLKYNTNYTVTLTVAAKDTEGNALAEAKTWSFTTAPELSLPTVISTSPNKEDIDVDVNTTITATFSKSMNASTLTAAGTFTVNDGSADVNGIVTYNESVKTATFTLTPPGTLLKNSTVYTVSITTAAKDTEGIAPAEAKTWSFTTQNTGIPVVALTNPLANATNVAVNTLILAAFSEDMKKSSITLNVNDGSKDIAGTVGYDNKIMTFTPDANLESDKTYTVTIAKSTETLAGIAMNADYVWKFTTLSSSSVKKGDINGDNAVDLKDAILALKVLAGFAPSEVKWNKEADINGDGKIGIAELVYILNVLATN